MKKKDDYEELMVEEPKKQRQYVVRYHVDGVDWYESDPCQTIFPRTKNTNLIGHFTYELASALAKHRNGVCEYDKNSNEFWFTRLKKEMVAPKKNRLRYILPEIDLTNFISGEDRELFNSAVAFCQAE